MIKQRTVIVFIMRFITLLIILLTSLPLFAGHYIEIDSIDACSTYPQIKVSTQLKGISTSDLSGINGENFSVNEDGAVVKNTIRVVKETDEENYLYLVLSIDSSKSISSKDLVKIKLSAGDIVRSVGPKDKIAIYHFDDEVMLLHDFTRNIQNIKKSINAIRRHGKKTLLYNSIHDSLVLFQKINQTNKKIIVFTDGKDEGSNITDNDIIQLARSVKIPIYFICFKDSKNIRTMARISKLTGGKLIYGKDHEDISGMYNTILSVMRNRYNVYYMTDLKKDGQNHELQIRLKLGELQDTDSKEMRMPENSLVEYFAFDNNAVYIAIIFLMLILLILIILFFIIREKRILKDYNSTSDAIIAGKITRDDASHDADENVKLISCTDNESPFFSAWLLQKNGTEIGKKFKISSRQISIGRSPDTSIFLNDDMASPMHAKIICREGVYHLLDLVSENGTYLNGKKLLRPKALHDWDEIKIGNTILIFRGSLNPA